MSAMKIKKRAFGALALAVTLVVQCHSQVQVAAPASFPACLIQYSTSGTLYGVGSRLILYNADQTYVVINSYLVPNDGGVGTLPSVQGTFTYAVDPQNAAHATIVYDGGKGNDELYFYSASSGGESASGWVPLAGSFTAFTFYPRQGTNGACNVSSLCQLATGGTGTCGFVIQSGGPRWVLLRASGKSLGTFGVSPTVSSPSFTLYDSKQRIQATSLVWSSDLNLVSGYQTIFSLLGAFPMKTGSDEGVLLVPLNPGAYTAQFKAGSAGTTLFECYILPF